MSFCVIIAYNEVYFSQNQFVDVLKIGFLLRSRYNSLALTETWLWVISYIVKIIYI